ncbi:MAG TPA: chloride channel protein [Acidimicrobiales bacterium]|nr:chloride channel protein [Acidimicrobiales bacterium]
MTVRRTIGRVLDIDRQRDVSLGETPGRMALLAGIGVVLGVIGGVAAFAIVNLVGLISNLALLHKVAFDLPDLQHYHPGPDLLLVAIGGAFVVALLARWAPTIKGHGIPESLEAIVFDHSRIPPKVVLAKPLSAAIAMGTGGPFGAEGPIIVTGGSAGSLIGQILRLSSAERRIALATGAAAGMAGVFATPIAAIIIAFELLLFERSLRALVPLLLATGIATQIHFELIGPDPLFQAFGLHTVSGWQLPLFVVLGIACGLMALVLNKGLFGFEALFRRSRIPEFFHPVVGAVGFGLIGLMVPGSLSVGYWAIQSAVNDRFLLGAAAILMVAKLFSWWIALASNTSGGTLAPIFIIGSTMGLMIGIGFGHAFPGLGIQPAAFAVVAMGATFGASARALLTGAVFALEATDSFELLVPMIITTAVAELVTHQFLDQRLMTDKLLRRGYRVAFDTEVDPFRMIVAGRAVEPLPDDPLDPDLPRIDSTAYVGDAVALLLDGSAEEIVVYARGEPIGVLGPGVIDGALARRLAERDPQEPTLFRGRGRGRRRRRRLERTPVSDFSAGSDRPDIGESIGCTDAPPDGSPALDVSVPDPSPTPVPVAPDPRRVPVAGAREATVSPSSGNRRDGLDADTPEMT